MINSNKEQNAKITQIETTTKKYDLVINGTKLELFLDDLLKLYTSLEVFLSGLNVSLDKYISQVKVNNKKGIELQ
jgi:hypothetical protein